MIGRMFKTGLAAFVAATLVGVMPSGAAPLLEVDSSTNGAGLFTYVVTNATPATEPSGVGYLVFPFGSDDGVFTASALGWVPVISADNTRFAHIAHAIPNGSSATFTLSSSYFDSTTGLMTSGGISSGSAVTYPAVSVIGPIVPEPVFGAMAMLVAAVVITRRRCRAH